MGQVLSPEPNSPPDGQNQLAPQLAHVMWLPCKLDALVGNSHYQWVLGAPQNEKWTLLLDLRVLHSSGVYARPL